MKKSKVEVCVESTIGECNDDTKIDNKKDNQECEAMQAGDETADSSTKEPTALAKDDAINSKNKEDPRRRKFCFISVHLGAGCHLLKKRENYKKICDGACEKAMLIMKSGGSAATAVVEAVKCLEDSGMVNAGCGSNLTLDGTVECDAGFMDGDGHFGGVGALSGVPNPVEVAKAIADVHRKEKLFSGGRVPPNFMVGSAAKRWTESQNIAICDEQDLISKKAKKTFEKYTGMLEDISIAGHVNDTIGAIALDSNGFVASAVSSGGNWLKLPGRIGHSPVFGCGCWSSNRSPSSTSGNNNAIALSVSGAGEVLSRVRLPQECAYVANSQIGSNSGLVASVTSCMYDKIIHNSSLDIHSEPRYVGLISLSWDGKHGEFAWGHTSENFVVAYSSSKMRSAKMHFSELGTGTTPGKSLKVEGVLL